MMALAKAQRKSVPKAANVSPKITTPTPTTITGIVTPIEVPLIQRKSACACGGDCPRCLGDELPVQAKLRISQPNDKYEQEADRMADQVMRMPEPAIQRQVELEEVEEEETLQAKPLADQITPLVQRQAEPEEEEEETLQTKPVQGHTTAVGPDLHNRIKTLQGGGRPLAPSERNFFEPRFGQDFSRVRLHTDSNAATATSAVNARAFTVGRDISFNKGEYDSNTETGKHLLAHELTHVIQQQGRAPSAMPQLMRSVYPGCEQATTGVSEPDAMVNRARSDAIAMVNRVLAALRALNSHTLLLLDRHFHCPASWQIRHIIRGFTQIRDELPNITNIRCRSSTDTFCSNPMLMGGHGESPLDLPLHEFDNLSPEELERGFEIAKALNLCPRFFSSTDDSRRAVTFMIHAAPMGSNCMKREPCYDDFNVPASSMIQNSYSYAWFAVELSGHPVRRPSIIPCRPIDTGTNVVVPPGAGSNSSLIRRLSGLDPTNVPGSVILQLYVDRGGRYFVYHDGPESGLYRPGERPRLYLPEGWSP